MRLNDHAGTKSQWVSGGGHVGSIWGVALGVMFGGVPVRSKPNERRHFGVLWTLDS